MPRKFDFNKDRIGLLAGLVEEDDFEEVRHRLFEEYRDELVDDVMEVDATLQEFMGYRSPNSEGEVQADCECPEEAKPNPEESGLPGWSYYVADPTYSKISTMDDDLQHKKEMQWYPPLESELESGYDDEDEDDEDDEDIDETKAFRNKVNSMINEHAIIQGTLPGIGFASWHAKHDRPMQEHDDEMLDYWENAGYGDYKNKTPRRPPPGYEEVYMRGWEGAKKELSGMKEQPDLPGELDEDSRKHFEEGERVGISPGEGEYRAMGGEWSPRTGVIVENLGGEGYGDPSYRVKLDNGETTDISWSMLFRV